MIVGLRRKDSKSSNIETYGLEIHTFTRAKLSFDIRVSKEASAPHANGTVHMYSFGKAELINSDIYHIIVLLLLLSPIKHVPLFYEMSDNKAIWSTLFGMQTID